MEFGMFKGQVVQNKDPQHRARIKVKCPSVYGEGISPWCEPCVPVAGDLYGDMCVPKLNETVWLGFEKADIYHPVWLGGWYCTDKAPEKGNIHIRVISYYDNIIIMCHNHETYEDQLKVYRKDGTLLITDDKIEMYRKDGHLLMNDNKLEVTRKLAKILMDDNKLEVTDRVDANGSTVTMIPLKITLKSSIIELIADSISLSAPDIALNGDVVVNGSLTVNGILGLYSGSASVIFDNATINELNEKLAGNYALEEHVHA